MKMRALAVLPIAALLASAAFAQPSESSAQFEAADVHRSKPDPYPFVSGPYVHGGRYELKTATMADLVRLAYGVDVDKVYGGPSWVEFDRFDVIAKVPPGAKTEDLPPMLKALLAERFKLAVHSDTKEFPTYALVAGPSPKMKPTDESSPPDRPGCSTMNRAVQRPADATGPISVSATTTCKATTMESFITSLRSMMLRSLVPTGATLPNVPIQDKTGLQGAWDFELKFGMPNGTAPVDIPITEALDKQLGLKLEPAKVSLPVVQVDSVNRKPTENSPDVAKNLPALPVEFDVAEIKPYTPPAGGANNAPMQVVTLNGVQTVLRMGGNGIPAYQNDRMNLQGYTLKNLINLAWDVNGDEYLAGAQKWMETDKWDVIAKAPRSVIGMATVPGRQAPTDVDVFRPMLRTLLIEKFKLAVHYEDRPVTAYILTAPKPKLQKADPAGRTKYINGPGPDGKDPRKANPAMSRLVYCQNVTMAEFATLLSGIASGYLSSVVEDKTGLEGSYDFVLNFSPIGMVNGGGGRGADPMAASAGSAADPSGGMSLFDAMSKQLGLKLEQQKRPAPVLVIDHADQKPIDN